MLNNLPSTANYSFAIILLTSLFFLCSALVIIARVGGVVLPVIMGRLDATNIQIAYIFPAVCFIVVFSFALRNLKVRDIQLSLED